MRTRIYVDGQPQWSENTPSRAGHASRGGHLITGGPGAYELARAAERRRKQAEAARLAEAAT